MIHVTKAGLYRNIDILRDKLGLQADEGGGNIIKLCEQRGLKIGRSPFYTPGLRGMAVVGDENNEDIILLNSARNPIEQNVDCAHECIHLSFHRNEPCRTFKCFETVAPGQDRYLEWQANEGGAELLVPHRHLLQRIKRYNHLLKNYANITAFKEDLTELYDVTDAVITYRLESLKYEIAQYLDGVQLNELQIISNTVQTRRGIYVKSLNDIAMDDLAASMTPDYYGI